MLATVLAFAISGSPLASVVEDCPHLDPDLELQISEIVLDIQDGIISPDQGRQEIERIVPTDCQDIVIGVNPTPTDEDPLPE